MLTTDRKGAIAELAISLAAMKAGIEVYRPMSEGGRYDLVFDIGRLVRVQCKWAPLVRDVVCVRLYSSRRTRAGVTRRLYTAAEIDAIAAYCPELDRCYYLPYERFNVHTQVVLRVAPTANNQQTKVNWARDYELERLNFVPRGAVAQLGERRDGIAKATGSSPVGSTPLTLVD